MITITIKGRPKAEPAVEAVEIVADEVLTTHEPDAGPEVLTRVTKTKKAKK